MASFALDLEVTNQVATAVRQGEWPQRALVRLGVQGAEASRWLQAGEQREQEGVDDSDEYVRLWRAVDVAEADCEKRWVTNMEAAAAVTSRTARVKPQDYMMMLERRFPARWCVKGDRGKGKQAESMEEALKRITAAE